MDVGWALTAQLGFLSESLGHRDIPTQSRALVSPRVQGRLGELLPCSALFCGLSTSALKSTFFPGGKNSSSDIPRNPKGRNTEN